MNYKTLCIVTALITLSIGAILVANPSLLGKFQSTLNGVPIKVTISPQDNADINTMRARDLRRDSSDHDGRFVRFTGVVDYVDQTYLDPLDFRSPMVVRSLRLEGYPSIYVYPLDAPNLPEEYQTAHKYEFTGFLMKYEDHAKFRESGFAAMRVYAFEIRHLGEAD